MELLVSLFPADWAAWVQAALALVGAASAVAAATPTPKDDTVIGKVYRVIDFVALNIAHAKETAPNRPR